jgi:hypothetical protein
MHTKPYWNERIITVIRNLFFTGGTSAYAHWFDSKFPRFRAPEGVSVVFQGPVTRLAGVRSGSGSGASGLDLDQT